VNLNFENL